MHWEAPPRSHCIDNAAGGCLSWRHSSSLSASACCSSIQAARWTDPAVASAKTSRHRCRQSACRPCSQHECIGLPHSPTVSPMVLTSWTAVPLKVAQPLAERAARPPAAPGWRPQRRYLLGVKPWRMPSRSRCFWGFRV
jgi:hypothetical protein